MSTYFMKFERNGNAPKTKIRNKVSIISSCIQKKYYTDLICNLCFGGITVPFEFHEIRIHWGIANNDL